MSTPPILSLTDCTDPNAVARQSARLAALFGAGPTIVPLTGADPEGTAALTLLDVLRAGGELLGGAGLPTVVLVNIAPRDGHWPNGVPFCHFRHNGHLVISTLNPRVLEPLRRHLGVTEVAVTDVREAVEAAAAAWAELRPAEVEEIVRTQFRSLWYVPLLARWLVDGRPVPARTETLAAFGSAADAARDAAPVGLGTDDDVAVNAGEEDAAAWPTARIAVVDNFGNCKFDLPAAALPGYPDSAFAVLDQASGGQRAVRCYPRLVDVPYGEPGVITGSSGYGFAELVVRGGSAARLFGLREGDEPLARAAEPVYAG
jgi:hypothetical protein